MNGMPSHYSHLRYYSSGTSADKSMCVFMGKAMVSAAVLLVLFCQAHAAQADEFMSDMPVGDYGDYGNYGAGDYGDLEDFSAQAYTDPADESTGNWYEKLRYLKSAKAQYDELSKHLTTLKERESYFAQQLKKLQEQAKSFYITVRIDPQTIYSTLDRLLAELKPAQETSASTEEQRIQLVEAADKQKAVEQLRQELDLLKNVYADIEKAYTKDLAGQLKQAEQYQESALDSFEQIEQTRSHEKAHELYKQVENSNENIQAIGHYIQNLDAYGAQAQAKIQQLFNRIRTSIENLEKQGIVVRYVTEQEKAQKLAAQQKQEEQERMRKAQRAQEKAERDRWNNLPWWQKFFEYIKMAGAWLLSWFKYPKK